MRLGEALDLVQRQKDKQQIREIWLVCGFQPLHLETFLHAHLAQRFPHERAVVRTGLYGNPRQTLGAAAGSHAEAAAVVIEWSDLDPRLGVRGTGGWALSSQDDITGVCRQAFAAMLEGLKRLAARMPVAVVPPSLPLSLLGHTPGWQLSVTEAELRTQAAAFVSDAARIANVSVVHPSALDRLSPEPSRLDAHMELGAGFPYTTAHASAVASLVVQLLFPCSPFKGLITDLDDTLWSGLVGEVGAQGVGWSLAEHAAIHGVYQQMLAHLSEMGVLLAVASKNDSAVVEQALGREDLLVPAERFFPVCANWGRKSESVAEILRVWNIGADSVVFIDDSPMELAEVQAAFPAMRCLAFAKKSPAKVMEMLEQLRDLLGKPVVHREDTLRQSSIRANASLQSAASANPVEFLRGLEGKLTFDWRKDPANKRPLDLINKTNQFNLNGVRITEGEWMRHLADPSAVVLSISYEDKFGPLGIIGVVAGRRSGRRLAVSTWVMSCRAFSRRIEHHTLRHLFDYCGADTVALDYQPTERNGPLREFLRETGVAMDGAEARVISKDVLARGGFELPHGVVVREELLRPGASSL